MPSAIDPTKPVTGQPASKADLRANLAAAKAEIEALQDAISGLTGGGVSVINAVADFGAVGDNSTDNSTALIAMRDYMLQDTSKLYRVYFPPGAYRYTNNRWLWRVQKIIIDAYDVSFMCCANAGHTIDNGPAYITDYFMTSGDVAQALGTTYSSGYRFNSAAIADDTITMTTTGEAANFSGGDRAFIFGFDQQAFESSYPPNLRYFEYKTVQSVNTGAGTVTFTEPLSFDYDSRWPDGIWADGTPTIYFGKPRIINLDRADYVFPRLIHIKGATFLANDQHPGNFFLLPCDRLIMEDVHCACYFWPSMCQRVHLLRCRFDYQFEIDKLITDILVEDSDVMDETQGATGVHRLIMRKCRLHGKTVPLARFMHFVDCDIYADPAWDYGLILGNQSWNTLAMTVTNCSFFNLAGSSLEYAINTNVLYSLTVGSVSGTNILLAWDATGKAVAGFLQVGSTLFKSDLSKSGTVTAMYHDGGSPGNLVIEGTWSAPVAAETWNWHWGEKFHDGGGNTIIGVQKPLWRDSTRVTGLT